MAAVPFQVHSCPCCQRAYETRLVRFSSGLGPPLLTCGKCDHPFNTDRREWPEMTVSARIWFLVASAVYLGAAWFIGGNLIDNAYQLAQGIRGPENFRLHAFPFQLGGFLTSAAVVGIQSYRLVSSIRRSRASTVPSASFWTGLHVNVQLKFLVTLVLLWLPFKVYALISQ